MTKTVLLLSLVILTTASLAKCSKMAESPRSDKMTTTDAPKPMPKDLSWEDGNLMVVMNECNETFRVEMSYLESLNLTGSFPDETDKTPKCYLRCLLENLNIASPEGVMDAEKAAVIFAGERNGEPIEDIKEITMYCAQRREMEKCPCERSYNFLKCLFSMEIEKYMKTKQ